MVGVNAEAIRRISLGVVGMARAMSRWRAKRTLTWRRHVTGGVGKRVLVCESKTGAK